MTAAARQVVFVDSRVADYQTLIDGLAEGSEWYLLHAGEDGIGQMERILSGYGDLDAIHVFSHGSPGALYLGNTVLNGENLDDYRIQLAEIGSSLTEAGDILLYGCEVGAGETGQDFNMVLAHVTGADVAASTNPTGAAALGGDWQLEQSTGLIDGTGLIESENAYKALLADWPDEEGIHWNKQLEVKGTDFTIPAYGLYGGPGWTGGDTGVLNPNIDGVDDELDKVFWQHDKDYGQANPDDKPIEVLTPEQKIQLANADLTAIAAMRNLGSYYQPSSDAMAYAGATTLAFLGQIVRKYQGLLRFVWNEGDLGKRRGG
ncbi:MAG TPA: DUF4347 domain-containing protein, partial [Candidatus Accumulibacter phosphatis]|nr:DUF4347 domain-containing protein [Candidatus Accumulibacter phosphatis]